MAISKNHHTVPQRYLKHFTHNEALEEVGLMPKKLVKLATFYPNPARNDWTATTFFCDDYTEAKASEADPSEVVEVVKTLIAKVCKASGRRQYCRPDVISSLAHGHPKETDSLKG